MKPQNTVLLIACGVLFVLGICAGVAHHNSPATPPPPPSQTPTSIAPAATAPPPPTAPEPAPAGPTPAGPAGPAPETTTAPPAAGPAQPTAPFGYDEAPELALAKDLGLTPEQAESVGQVLRECNAELDREMLDLMERGYDDVVAKQIGERHEARVVKRVAEVLPAEARPRFRALIRR